MTFLEAAIEVLRREGKALPAKRLAELALKLNLLSVVGRDPEGTMQSRLEDAVEKDAARSPVVRVKPGIYGLRAYPAASAVEAPAKPEPKPAPAAKPAAEAAEAAPEGEAPAEKKSRRRRGGRGRGKAEAAPPEAEAPVEKAAEPEPKAEEKPAEAKAEEGGEGKRRRRSRRGGRGRRREGEAGQAEAPAVEEASVEAEAPAVEVEPAVVEEPAAVEEPRTVEAEVVEDDELLDEMTDDNEGELDVPSGPLLAPSHGSEELTRSDEDRAVRAEILGRRERDDRGRHRRGERGRERGRERGGRDRDRPRPAGPAQPAQAHAHAHAHAQPQAQPQAQLQPAVPSTGKRGVLDACFEILRAGDGRPVHVRHLAEQAQKRGFLDGAPADVVRLVRAALIRELRDREADGLRPRVRALGGGHYALGDRKLEPDLAQAERELADKTARLRDLARATLRRRLPRLSGPAFEALCRMLLEKMGLPQVELVRRGEGVAYFGGVRTVGIAQLKTLIAVRPGEAEISRRAVGELRAGLAARGYDEGILLAAGRGSGEALAELKAGTGVTVHDGQSLAALLARHGIGLKRALIPVEYLDLELLTELSEG